MYDMEVDWSYDTRCGPVEGRGQTAVEGSVPRSRFAIHLKALPYLETCLRVELGRMSRWKDGPLLIRCAGFESSSKSAQNRDKIRGRQLKNRSKCDPLPGD